MGASMKRNAISILIVSLLASAALYGLSKTVKSPASRLSGEEESFWQVKKTTLTVNRVTADSIEFPINGNAVKLPSTTSIVVNAEPPDDAVEMFLALKPAPKTNPVALDTPKKPNGSMPIGAQDMTVPVLTIQRNAGVPIVVAVKLKDGTPAEGKEQLFKFIWSDVEILSASNQRRPSFIKYLTTDKLGDSRAFDIPISDAQSANPDAVVPAKFLYLSGTGPKKAKIKFSLAKTDASGAVVEPVSELPTDEVICDAASGEWRGKLDLDDAYKASTDPEQKFKIWIRAELDDLHSFASRPILIQMTPAKSPESTAPQVDRVFDISGPETEILGNGSTPPQYRMRLNRKLKITLKDPPDDLKAPQNTARYDGLYVVVRDGNGVDVAKPALFDSVKTPGIVIPASNITDESWTFAYVRGEKQSEPGAQITIKRSSTGPKVKTVDTENPGGDPTKLKLTIEFDGEVNDTSAKKVANYVLTPRNVSGATPLNPDASRLVGNKYELDFNLTKISATEYDLKFKPMTQDYTDGIKDVFGNPLEDGPPLTNFKMVVGSPGTLLEPNVTNISNSPFTPSVFEGPAAAGVVVSIYDNKLRLRGNQAPLSGSISFVVQKAGTQETVGLTTPALIEGNVWSAELDLSQLRQNQGQEYHLWIKAESGSLKRFASQHIKFKLVPELQSLSAPTISVPASILCGSNRRPLDYDNAVKRHFGNERLYKATIALQSIPAGELITPGDSFVALTNLNGTILISTRLTQDSQSVEFPVSVGGDGRTAYDLIYFRGDKKSVAIRAFELDVRIGGLRVLSVLPEDFGTRPGVTSLTVAFPRENPLKDDSAVAQASRRVLKTENFELRQGKGTGDFDRADNLVNTNYDDHAPVTYDKASNSVFLRFKTVPADTYRLDVKGASLVQDQNGPEYTPGIRDIYGNTLEDGTGTPVATVKTVLSPGATTATGLRIPTVPGAPVPGSAEAAAAKAAAAEAAALAAEKGEVVVLDPSGRPSVSRGITGETGKSVEFPEYVTPRKPVEGGISSSDRVETRVARLYYFRDAHRVAQIINRDVKSYNYQAVAVTQRLADRARDIANKLTDERRAQERAAVEAARKTREAQAELDNAQNALKEARKSADRASVIANESAVQSKSAQDGVAQAEAALAAATAENNKNPSQANADKVKIETDNLTRAKSVLQTLSIQNSSAQNILSAEANNIATAESRVSFALAALSARRDAEVSLTERSIATTAQEERAQQEQFRREVAAAREDPDTYAPGKVDSQDPVQQCSISVIGEGEIHIRGPIKGINIIRMMIEQIDSPVGQVRVAIHTVQVNGEHEQRMEKVAGRIQKYIDHSRFLTAQSAQMLRRAVVTVASRKAEMAALTCPPEMQAARDQKYMYSFFGQDFINELYALDSEFLRSGNKLLSLHSMDATSLSSALFLMALAKNSVRAEILDEFTRMTAEDLPAAEMSYLEASFDKDHKKFPLTGANARFQSLRGYFNTQIRNDDTMTPIQREFVRLAQIFKSRLVTEIELKQRVTERTIIEERFAKSYQELIKEQRRNEDRANEEFAKSLRVINSLRPVLAGGLTEIDAVLRDISEFLKETRESLRNELAMRDVVERNTIVEIEKKHLADLSRHYDQNRTNDVTKQTYIELRRLSPSEMRASISLPTFVPMYLNLKEKSRTEGKSSPANLKYQNLLAPWLPYHDQIVSLEWRKVPNGYDFKFETTDDRDRWNRWIEEHLAIASNLRAKVSIPPRYEKEFSFLVQLLESMKVAPPSVDFPLSGKQIDHRDLFERLKRIVVAIVEHHTETIINPHQKNSPQLIFAMGDPNALMQNHFARWVAIRNALEPLFPRVPKALKEAKDPVREKLYEIDAKFAEALKQSFVVQIAREQVEQNRRPLDHKKLLDVLIDDVEDKYIDLLEGTRAHTANFDNYIKMISTALDDDFQTQFYIPAFRFVRQASNFWDVTFGQIETTSILTNNRAFAKVSPQATMEFDLPRRNILIAEAMQGSMAMMNTYGALLTDPTFLALTQLNSGQPTSTPVPGGAGGFSIVRNVIPGLPSSTEERVMSQAGPGERRFATPLEALIPDPAIYKIETGTGYEIRPVIGPDGQSVVFHFNYMYTTNIREPVRADEKHLGRVKQHFIDTDVQLGNYELREISRYVVALKVARTAKGVPLLQDIPGVGVLFRPLPSAESSLQENIILGQATIFPTLFDLMGLRWAPAVAELDPLRTTSQDFVYRMRLRDMKNHVYDFSASKVDEFLRVPPADRRTDLYRTQETIPYQHPNGYAGPGLNLQNSNLREGLPPPPPESSFIPADNPNGSPFRSGPPRVGELPMNGPPTGLPALSPGMRPGFPPGSDIGPYPAPYPAPYPGPYPGPQFQGAPGKPPGIPQNPVGSPKSGFTGPMPGPPDAKPKLPPERPTPPGSDSSRLIEGAEPRMIPGPAFGPSGYTPVGSGPDLTPPPTPPMPPPMPRTNPAMVLPPSNAPALVPPAFAPSPPNPIPQSLPNSPTPNGAATSRGAFLAPGTVNPVAGGASGTSGGSAVVPSGSIQSSSSSRPGVLNGLISGSARMLGRDQRSAPASAGYPAASDLPYPAP